MSRLMPKVVAVGFLLLLLLWGIGMFVAPLPAAPSPSAPSYVFNSELSSRQQAANNLRQLKLDAMPVPLLLDRLDAEGIRVHERSAHLTSSSRSFDDDEKAVRRAVAGHDALVLHEQSSGLDGRRRLSLEISVRLDKFDELTARLQSIGRLEAVSVHERDRTAEFRRLRGQQQRLKQQREAVAKLRGGKESSAEDQLRILQKLHDLDKELQTVTDQAGDLLGKESYYQVYLTLNEETAGASSHGIAGIPRRAGYALVWAAPWWLVLMATLGLVPGVYVSVKTLLGGGKA